MVSKRRKAFTDIFLLTPSDVLGTKELDSSVPDTKELDSAVAMTPRSQYDQKYLPNLESLHKNVLTHESYVQNRYHAKNRVNNFVQLALFCNTYICFSLQYH